MIPKIIHYCWLSKDPIPKDMQMFIDGWYEKLPDYEFMLWDFNRFDIHSSQWVKEAFSKKNCHEVALVIGTATDEATAVDKPMAVM